DTSLLVFSIFFRRFGSVLNPEEVNNFYVATGIDTTTGSIPISGSSPASSAAISHSPMGSSGLSGTPGGFGSRPLSPTRPHPERMPDGPPLTRTLDPVGDQGSAGCVDMMAPAAGQVSSQAQSAIAAGAAAGMKRFKWHLGIRSQSRPWDIMHEVFKAMNTLGYEWKVINPFNVRVRKWNPVLQHFSKLVLQLYQVDARSYLLDFKCIDESQMDNESAALGRRRSNNTMGLESPYAGTSPGMTASLCSTESSRPGSLGSVSPLPVGSTDALNNPPELVRTLSVATQDVSANRRQKRHQTMEFFEMCTELITTLAR
ncbi:hypothetical protein EG68_11505, partial [Paragonimus skrjabini miyazakii]